MVFISIKSVEGISNHAFKGAKGGKERSRMRIGGNGREQEEGNNHGERRAAKTPKRRILARKYEGLFLFWAAREGLVKCGDFFRARDRMAQGITNKTQLLLSSVELPDDAALHYSIYSSPSQDPLAALEAARRKLMLTGAGTPLEAHLITSPFSRIHFDNGKPVLYVFRLLSSGDDAPGTLLDDLTRESVTYVSICIPKSS
jgi:hypothetical protein